MVRIILRVGCFFLCLVGPAIAASPPLTPFKLKANQTVRLTGAIDSGTIEQQQRVWAEAVVDWWVQ